MVIASAFTENLPDSRHGSEILGAKLEPAERRALMQSIRDRGIDYVAQEAVTLSSMPVWRDGRLQPRPFTLRLFLAKVGDGWQVLPGGLRPHRRRYRCPRREPAARRRDRRRLGAGARSGRRNHHAAVGGANAGAADERIIAEPSRR